MLFLSAALWQKDGLGRLGFPNNLQPILWDALQGQATYGHQGLIARLHDAIMMGLK